MLARERRAVAAGVFAAYGLALGLLALPDSPFRAFLGTLAATYGVGFFALAAGYFWARWLARGIAISGALTGAMFAVMAGPGMLTLLLTASHALVALALTGEAVAVFYDGRTDWRARFSLGDGGVRRLGVVFENLGVTLPFAAYYGFFPRSGAVVTELGAMAALSLGALGLVGLARMRTWGWLAAVAGLAAFTLGLLAGGLLVEATLLAGLATLVTRPFASAAGEWLRG